MKKQLKLTKFQAEVIYHALGVDIDYEEYELDSKEVKLMEKAEDILRKMTYPDHSEYPIHDIIHSASCKTIPSALCYYVGYVLDDICERSTYLDNSEMYVDYLNHSITEGQAEAILQRTADTIQSKADTLMSVSE